MESPGSRKKVVASLNYSRVEEVGQQIARTICAMDYKGFSAARDVQNAVIEARIICL